MRTKQKNNTLLILACVFGYLAVAVSVLGAIALAFNLFGVADIYVGVQRAYFGVQNAENTITMYIIELGITALMNLSFTAYYQKGVKYKINSKQYGKSLIYQAIFQMLISSFLPAIFALIAGIRMNKEKSPIPVANVNNNPYLSEYKMEVMSDAVKRLKELKEQGAISEEEYFASLNKILES